MTLTTPMVKDFDNIFPGENWFFYWKTSSSLWEEKLSKAGEFDTIVIPINWGFHSETGDKFDFGQEKPEANLAKLVRIIQDLGKKATFLVSSGPTPYLPNGGIPFLLAKEPGFYHQKMWLTLDGEKNLHKLYSFYEPKVFKGFQKFVSTLRHYLTDENIQASIYSFSSHFVHSNRVISFFEDSSPSYEQAFKRFLEGQDRDDLSLRSVDEERDAHTSFRKSIKELYEQTILEGLDDYWDGAIDVCFLGANPHNFINRSFEKEDELSYFSDMLTACSLNMLPSTVLLGQERSDLLKKVSRSYFVDILAHDKIGEQFYEDEGPITFNRLKLFSLFSQSGQDFQRIWQKNHSPLKLLEKRFQGTSLFLDYSREKVQSIIDSERDKSIHFFLAQFIDKTVFNSIIKLFMHGKKIIIDVNNIPDEFNRKLEAFFIENKLDVQKVNFRTIVRSISLGEGQLLLYSSEELEVLDQNSIEDFWIKILSLFTFVQPEVTADSGIVEYWLDRAPINSELNFESIRRLSICNVMSYKQKAKIKFSKNFLVLKVLDEENVKVNIETGVIEVVFASKGSVSIDFGFIEAS